jgi:hypothetical protein
MAAILRSPDGHTGAGLSELLLPLCLDVLGLDALALSVLLPDGGQSLELLQASDERAARAEDLQYTHGQGPSLDAARTGQPVLVPDLSDTRDQPWPALPADLLDLDIAAVAAVPVELGAIRLGALTGYRTTPGALTQDQLADAFTLAEATTRILLDQTARRHDPAAAFDDQPPLHRAELHQATGMVAAQLHLSLADALIRIRSHAYAHNQPLLETSQAILAGRLRLHDGRATGGQPTSDRP